MYHTPSPCFPPCVIISTRSLVRRFHISSRNEKGGGGKDSILGNWGRQNPILGNWVGMKKGEVGLCSSLFTNT
ncbi:hypothetical protein AAHA92_04882 [Salvia divinorum]|uniref:Uncharacterized protein n=1 Tax=Salvia divinorum TaxID=28513 RepID=A0ABD1I0N9_SALDI